MDASLALANDAAATPPNLNGPEEDEKVLVLVVKLEEEEGTGPPKGIKEGKFAEELEAEAEKEEEEEEEG